MENTSDSYGGLGAGGKFRRHTSRRAGNAKPYDRPVTALRIPTNGGESGGGNGWLAKLMDPAQRLISYSAHRLFASVFRKRIPPAPPQHASPQSRESSKEERDEREESASLPKRTQVMINGGNIGAGDSGRTGVTELEQTLKQKTFTRSEIDRLTALLHSKSSDMPSGQEENRSQMTPSKPVLSCEGKGRLESTPIPVRENGVESHLTLTPVVNQSVHDEDVVSPTELAKAYMGSRTSKASPLTDDTSLRGIRHIPQDSPAMSIVPRSAVPASASHNGFITPRSRGRSAIYNMARTPYTRVNSRTNLKDSSISVDINARPQVSASLSIWEQNKRSAPGEGSLKRRSSVLQNDIGSVGPIRRIRQKPNLLSSRSLMQRASTIGADARQDSRSSIDKMSPGNELYGNLATKFAPVSSKSSEMASKILQQLDKIVSSKEKSSPTKISPSRLRGKALRSLEKVDSSRFLENVQDYNKVTQSSVYLPSSHDSAPENLNKTEESRPIRLLGLHERVTSSASVLDASFSAKDTTPSIKCADTDATKHDAYNPQKRRAFQMSIPDEAMDWDDDSHPYAVPLSIPAEDRGKKKSSDSDRKIVFSEATAIRQPQAASDIKSLPIANTRVPDNSVAAEENAAFTFPTVSSTAASGASFSQQHTTSDNATPLTSFEGKAASSAGQSAMSCTPIFSFGDKVTETKELNVSPVFSFADKVTPVKEVNAPSPIISSDSKNVSRTSEAHSSTSPVSGQSGSEAGTLPTSKSESSSGLATTSVGVTGPEHPAPERTDDKSNIFKIPEAVSLLPALPSTSAASIFSFGASSASPSNFTSQSPSSSSAIIKSFPVSTSTDHVSCITAPSPILSSAGSPSPVVSTISSASALKLDSATVPSSLSSTVAVNSGAESDDKTSNLSSSLFSSTSMVANTGSSIFGLAPGTSSTINNSSQGSPFSSCLGVTTNLPFTAQASSTGAGAGAVTSTQSTPVQFGSSASSPSFGLGVNLGSSTKSSLFSSSAAATNLFPPGGNTSGQNPLASSSEGNFGSSGAAPTDLSATAVQLGKSSIFGSTFSTNGCADGASSTGAGASNAAPVVFGSSNSSSLSSSFFPFTSSTSSTSAQPVLGTSAASAQPIFGSTSTASAQPIFGSTSAASAQPIFGSTSATSSQSIFGSTSAAPSQPIFGGASATSSQPIFGGASAASSQPIFGGTSAASSLPIFGGASAASSQPIFGGTSAASSLPIFGGASAAFSQPILGGASATSSQPIFGGASATSSQPIFGGASATSSQSIFGGASATSSQSIFGGASATSSQSIFGGASATSSQPIFGGASAVSSQPIFGGASAASSQPAFGSNSASSQPAFGSTSMASQPAFGNHSSGFPFGSVSSGNNDQMSMEDSMAEDTVHASTLAPATSLFGQQPISHQQSNFVFGSTTPSGPSPFQFGSQQNQSTSLNPSPFQASGSLDFHAGGSFSLGSGGGDKSKRKIVRVKHRGRK